MNEVFDAFRKLLKKAEAHVIREPADKHRYHELHPSSFPYCGLRHLYEHRKHGMPKHRETNFRSDYYTSMGHTFHSVFQRNLGRHVQIIGDWACHVHKCGGHRKFSANHTCPKCGAEMEYQELGIKWGKFIVGHVDGLFLLKIQNKFYVLDYKTSSVDRINEHYRTGGTYFPYKGNVAQITSYCVLLEELYDVKIRGWFLMYASRDNPFKYNVITGDSISVKQKGVLKRKLQRWDKEFGLVFSAKTFAQVKPIIEKKPCATHQQYMKKMHNDFNRCPLDETGLCYGPKLEFVIQRLIERSRGKLEI